MIAKKVILWALAVAFVAQLINLVILIVEYMR